MANVYSPFASQWDINAWQNYCPNFQYRVVQQAELPPFLPQQLTSKFNCALIVASGSNTNQTYVIQGYRVDGTELDEHQYIVTFNKDKNTSIAGFVDHADYTGRTTTIPQEMQHSMSLSGVSAAYQFPTKPPHCSGSLQELIDQGLIKGFANSVDVQAANQ